MAKEIPRGEEVHTIYGDQKAAQECYFATVKEMEKEEESVEQSTIPKLEPEDEYELFVLDQLKPNQKVHIRRNLPIDLRMKLSELLDEYKHILLGLP